MNITRKLWYREQGQDIYLFTLSNCDIQLNVTNLGCTVTAIDVLRSNGERQNIVLGYNSAKEYLEDRYYTGCIVGRFAGRISGASFDIGGQRFHLTPNEITTGNHLHGGYNGFNKKIFRVSDLGCSDEHCFIRFETVSPHLEEGYPGDLQVGVMLELDRNNEIVITYEARTNMPTHVNLTHHHYFNLSGSGSGIGQELTVYADKFLVSDKNFIPTGTFAPLNNFCLKRGLNDYVALHKTHPHGLDATLRDPASGLTLDISTTYPCIVVYSGDYLEHPFQPSQGVCLETQFFPDAPNQPYLPSTLLLPGNIYFHETKMALKNI